MAFTGKDMEIIAATAKETADMAAAVVLNQPPVTQWFAGEDLSGERIVYASSASQVKYADKDTPEQASLVIGVTSHAASFSDEIRVQIRGLMIEPSWNWTPGLKMFLGNDGMMTQDLPLTGFSLEIGVAVEETAIYVFIRVPVLLEV